ncbi:MAG: hypothetical protein J6K60_07090, partial [Barnesiella sp.]|nr:hypothetical protein [Barnesiella sp.]
PILFNNIIKCYGNIITHGFFYLSINISWFKDSERSAKANRNHISDLTMPNRIPSSYLQI